MDNFNETQAEINQLTALLDLGVDLTLRGKTYKFKQPYAYTLDCMAAVLIKMDVNADIMKGKNLLDIFNEQKRMLSGKNLKLFARMAAIAYLVEPWKIRLLTPYYTYLFYTSMTPADMQKLTNILLQQMNLSDFTNSIVLMSINRTTAPQTVE